MSLAQYEAKMKECEDFLAEHCKGFFEKEEAERLRLAGKNKDEGNELFKAGKFDDAIRRYRKACEHLTRPEVKEQANAIMTSCHLNTAQSYIKAAGTQEAE